MSEFNWDLAPYGAVELVRNGFRVAYRDKAGNAYLSTGWEYSESWDLAEVIATRPQTKTVADEGEKWTHTTSLGRCRVLIDTPDEHGYLVVEMEDDGYSLVPPRSLKPIKLKLTVKEYELLARMAAYFCIRDSEFDEYMSKFDSELII